MLVVKPLGVCIVELFQVAYVKNYQRRLVYQEEVDATSSVYAKLLYFLQQIKFEFLNSYRSTCTHFELQPVLMGYFCR